MEVLSMVIGSGGAAIRRGTVVEPGPEERVWVEAGETLGRVLCDVLEVGNVRPVLCAGDEVLVWHSEEELHGVVLGRLGRAQRAAVATPADTPDELVLEAKKNLTLRCGDGSITIRVEALAE